MKSFKATACAKFILLGEHFIVHRACSAIVFPIPDLQCVVKLTPNNHQHYKAEFPVSDVPKEVIENYMARATYAACSMMGVDITLQPLRVESSSNFPISRGFGSSASFSVALVQAINEYRKFLNGQPLLNENLMKTAYSVESLFHKNSSGVDTTAVLQGRPLLYEKINQFQRIHNSCVDFVLVDSGQREGASSFVEKTTTFKEKNEKLWEGFSKKMQTLVHECVQALQGIDAKTVGCITLEAHGILLELGLSSPVVEELLLEARKVGALGGKVSGAGGGGAVVLITKKSHGLILSNQLKQKGYAVISVVTGEEPGAFV